MHSQRVIHLNQRNRTRNNPDTHPERQAPSHPADEVKIGIDFWHAVEFSRNRRTPTRNLSATRRGNPSSLDPHSLSVKSRPEPDQMTRGSPSKVPRAGIPIPRRLNAVPVKDVPSGGLEAHRRRREPTPPAPRMFPGRLPSGTDHLSVSVPPCRATSRTLGSAPHGVKSVLDHARTRGDSSR